MGYQYHPNQTAGREIVRILREEIDAVRGTLNQARTGDSEAVHECRRRLKKARSLLKMARYAEPAAEIAAARRDLGRAGRLLASWRDQDALLECIQRLMAAEPEPSMQSLLESLQDVLKEQAPSGKGGANAFAHAVDEADRLLKDTRATFKRQYPPELTWETLCLGMKRCYRNARKTGNEVRSGPAAASLHQWRKDAKHLRHQFALLSPVWPAFFASMEAELHALTDALGNAHDLMMLEEAVEGMAGTHVSRRESGQLRRRIERHIQVERDRALRLGGFLFVEKPSEFHRRCRQYIALWLENAGANSKPSQPADHRKRQTQWRKQNEHNRG